MLNRLWFKIKHRLLLWRLTTAQRIAEEWSIESSRMRDQLVLHLEHLQYSQAALLRLQSELQGQIESASKDLDKTLNLQQQHETVVESLRSENTIKGSEIEVLEAANQKHLQRERAEMAIHTMRQAAATTREDR